MSDNDMDYEGLAHAIRKARTWPVGVAVRDVLTGASDAIDQLLTRVAELEADRQTLQRDGRHPAPCARHCEAAAFSAEISLRDSQISKLENDKKLLHKAAGQLLKAWQEPSDKGEKRAAFDNYMTVAQRMGLYGGSEE